MSYPPEFLLAFDRLIGHEGAFTDDKRDPGNWTGGRVGVGVLKGTKYGIAANTYPFVDIRNLTLDQAREIYYTDWWLKAGGDVFPFALTYQLWTFAVNAGMSAARRCLQRAAKVAADGHIGPRTVAAVTGMSLSDVILRFNAECIRHYKSLSTWPTFGKGWMERIAGQLDYAAEDTPDEIIER